MSASPTAASISAPRGAVRGAAPRHEEPWDAVVIGAGFGGLGAALRLSESGARVLVLEALTYPGGCASTYTRGGLRYEAGATLFSGFGEGQLFRGWIERYGMDVRFAPMDPVVELRTDAFRLSVTPRRADLLAAFLAMPEAPEAALRRFFAEQADIAATLWDVLDRPALLPPFTAAAWREHLARVPRYLPLLPLLGQPIARVLERRGLGGFAPLRTFLDALSQITVQAGVDEAEALFALATMDYYFRGTGHVAGGIGRLAWELVRAIEQGGGAAHFADRARALRRTEDGWEIDARRGTVRARAVFANLLPQDLAGLLGTAPDRDRTLGALARAVESGWGAAMLYRVLRDDGGGPRHLELIDDPAQPLREGNHVFCSLGEGQDAPDGGRVQTMTVSTHVPLRAFLAKGEREQAERANAMHARMRALLARLAPEWEARTLDEMTASPRTFARFTRRHAGFVGGIPRRAGLHNYRRVQPIEVRRGLYLVGDTAFPGQSTLAAATGGVKAAEAAARGVLRRHVPAR